MNWKGVIPAITTNLDAAGAIDHAALGRHCEWMIRSGCAGIVCCGSLGEQPCDFEEKLASPRRAYVLLVARRRSCWASRR